MVKHAQGRMLRNIRAHTDGLVLLMPLCELIFPF